MNKQYKEIGDDEIRVISAPSVKKPQRQPWIRRNKWWLLIAIVVVAIAVLVYFLFHKDDNEGLVEENEYQEMPIVETPDVDNETTQGYVTVVDTIINNTPLKIFTPVDLTPSLYIGREILDDPSVKMAFHAADIREDNGEIVGAYVLKGDLISKGRSKVGFCAIIDGKATIGAADATPMLEQAIESDGYFFRQYPLVVGRQIVENKPKGKSLRKALAEIDGQIVVVVAEDRLTFHDFSQCLVDLGATNAIYLLGSTAYGFAKDEKGEKIGVGDSTKESTPYTNYILWK